jgi:hypothetical protein
LSCSSQRWARLTIVEFRLCGLSYSGLGVAGFRPRLEEHHHNAHKPYVDSFPLLTITNKLSWMRWPPRTALNISRCAHRPTHHRYYTLETLGRSSCAVSFHLVSSGCIVGASRTWSTCNASLKSERGPAFPSQFSSTEAQTAAHQHQTPATNRETRCV